MEESPERKKGERKSQRKVSAAGPRGTGDPALDSTPDLEETTRLILNQLRQVVPFDRTSIQLLRGGYLVTRGEKGSAKNGRTTAQKIPVPGDNPHTIVVETRQPYIVENAPEHYQLFREKSSTPTRSWLGVPLIVRGKVIGILAVENNLPNFFQKEHARLVSAFANQAAAAIENRRLYREAVQSANQRSILHRVSQDMITAIREPEETYQSIHQAARQLMPCDTFVISLLEESQKEYRLVYAVEGDYRFPRSSIPAGRGLTGQVIERGESIIINDLIKDRSDIIPIGDAQPVQSLVAAPLRLGGKTTGMISSQSFQPGAYGVEEKKLLEMLATYAAIAIENTHLYQEAVRAADRHSILHDASQEIIMAGLDLEKVYEAVHRAALRMMPGEAFVLSTLDESRKEILFAYLFDEGTRFPSSRSPMGSGLSGKIIETGKALLINDLKETPLPEGIDFGEGELVRSILAVPLRLGNKVVGMISVQSYKPHSYTQEDQSMLEMLGAHATAAMENARLFGETRQRLTELEAVNRISTALRTAQTTDQMLPILLDESLKILGADSGSIWLANPTGNTLEQVESRGWLYQFQGETIHPGDDIAGKVYLEVNPILSPEFSRDENIRKSIRNRIPEGWSGVGVPIQAGKEVIGVIIVSLHLPRQIQESDVRLLTTITEIAGNAIQRSNLYENSQLQLQRLASLRTIDMAISTVLDLRVTLNILIDHLLSQLQVDAVVIFLLNPTTQILYHGSSSGFRTDMIKKWQSYVSEGLTGQVARTRKSIYVPNLALNPAINLTTILANEEFISYMGVPLLAKGQVKGVLEIFNRKMLNPDLEWNNFLSALAGQAAIAIDNACFSDHACR